MSLDSISTWSPFRIDALGLVTLFGAEETSRSLGRLTTSWITEWVPLLSAYTVANNQITQPQSGFVLYNITDGIVATDICGWFTRWLLSYPISYAATTITLQARNPIISHGRRNIAIMLGAMTTFPLLILACFMRDWWGVTNTFAVMVSILVRQRIISELRKSVDKAVKDISHDQGEQVKIFITLPDGKAVTLYGPRTTVVDCILTDPRPSNPLVYSALRLIAWAAFGTHAITLGMATLINQIFCVCTLIACTVLMTWKVGDNPSVVGTRLGLEVDTGDVSWTRSKAYARLALTENEEEYMVNWNLFPQRKNEVWWNSYRRKEEFMRVAQNPQDQLRRTIGPPPSFHGPRQHALSGNSSSHLISRQCLPTRHALDPVSLAVSITAPVAIPAVARTL